MTDSKYCVALELGFPPHVISRALRERSFQNAGDLVDYLNENLYTSEDEVEEMDTSESNDLCTLLKCAMSLNDNTSPKLDETNLLLKETTELFASVHCLQCKIERRGILTFPCCHVALCTSCSVTTHVCPSKNCLSPIDSTLRVRF